MKDLFSLQQELKTLDQKIKGAKHLNRTPKAEGELEAIAPRMYQAILKYEKTQKQAELAQLRSNVVLAVHHSFNPRAYKELPHFFKFCLFKNKPRRFLVQGKVSEFIEPVKEHIDFRGLRAEVTYFEGELGDPDRMVYLAILNEALRHKEFVREFGKIPFSLDELGEKAGFSKHRRKERVKESLQRLMSTSLLFKSGVGQAHFKDRFHLIARYSSIEKTKAKEEVTTRLQTLRALPPNDVFVTSLQQLEKQSQALFDKFEAHAPKLTFVTFNEPLMEAINGQQVTTIDMWTVSQLERPSARTLFLFLYDVSQWHHSPEPIELPLQDLLQLMDLTPENETKKDGQKYIRWNRTREKVEEIFNEVNQVAQGIQWVEWVGEGENTVLRVRLSDEILQIPPKSLVPVEPRKPKNH